MSDSNCNRSPQRDWLTDLFFFLLQQPFNGYV